MYIILNYRGTKEYAEKSEVRKRVSFPRQSSHLCLPAKTRLLSMETEGLKQDCLPWKQRGSATLCFRVCIFGGRGDLWTQDRRVQHVYDKTQHAFWRTRSFLKTGDTTWTPCGAVNRKGMASGSSQAACTSQFWHHSSWETSLNLWTAAFLAMK